MKWSETVASQCRYGDTAERIFGKAEIIWEHSSADYQGTANILAFFPGARKKRFAHYEWTYGSCSGCDEWESRGLSDEQIEREMRGNAAWFDSAEQVRRYLRLEGEYEHASVPTAQSPTAGSIPGMLRWLGDGIGGEFREMGEAFVEWQYRVISDRWARRSLSGKARGSGRS